MVLNNVIMKNSDIGERQFATDYNHLETFVYLCIASKMRVLFMLPVNTYSFTFISDSLLVYLYV